MLDFLFPGMYNRFCLKSFNILQMPSQRPQTQSDRQFGDTRSQLIERNWILKAVIYAIKNHLQCIQTYPDTKWIFWLLDPGPSDTNTMFLNTVFSTKTPPDKCILNSFNALFDAYIQYWRHTKTETDETCRFNCAKKSFKSISIVSFTFQTNIFLVFLI